MKNKTKTRGESGSSPSGKYNEDGPGNSRSGLRGVIRVGEWDQLHFRPCDLLISLGKNQKFQRKFSV